MLHNSTNNDSTAGSSAASLIRSAELLSRLQAGDSTAAEAIFERYADRLTRLARSRLAARLAARVDPEDIVMSAYRSFFVAARDGRFHINSGGDLWRLLAEVTLHKLYRQVERQRAARRSVDREVEFRGDEVGFSREATPEEAATAADELETLLKRLEQRGREVVELRLAGYEEREIAARLRCTERTVRRWLAQARKLLQQQGGEGFKSPPIPDDSGRSNRGQPISPPPALVMPPGPLLNWQQFTLRRRIGAGATGKVYRATHTMSGREVAVKFLRKALVAEPRALEQFLREARLVANLKHPGIVGIEGLGRTPGGGLFLVMELVEGNNLETIGASGGVTPGQAVAWIATAAQAVHFAHEQGVIHCDLKPANLLLDNAGLVRVTDFGLAVHPVTEPRTNLLAGTPAFMAPEQVDACWGQISPRTDVYGLGAVLYFLLFGRPPHAGKGMADVLAHVVCGKPVPLPETPLVSPQLAAVLMRMLAKPPAERFVSSAEVAEALMNALPR